MVWYFASNMQEADANVRARIVGILGALGAAILTNFYTKRREINARHFSEKREAYRKIIDIVFQTISSTRSGKALPKKALVDKMAIFKKELMVWGSPGVIQAWNSFELQSQNAPDTDPRNIVTAMERVLRVIRKDLGHDDRLLGFGSLFGLVIVAEDKEMFFGVVFHPFLGPTVKWRQPV